VLSRCPAGAQQVLSRNSARTWVVHCWWRMHASPATLLEHDVMEVSLNTTAVVQLRSVRAWVMRCVWPQASTQLLRQDCNEQGALLVAERVMPYSVFSEWKWPASHIDHAPSATAIV
jgi:hypothetical protein